MIDEKGYLPPFLLGNKHLQTIIPTFFRKVSVTYKRETLTTPDDDFIDVDWIKNDHSKLVVLFHGLEGHSYSQYIRGLAKALSENNYDVLSVNFRGCSGRPNKKLQSYHSGQTQDYKFLFNHIQEKHNYKKVFAVGFSLGGNALLKYLGEAKLHANINKAVAVSVPCDLKASADKLSRGISKIYLKRFLIRLKEKVKEKEQMFPDAMDYSPVYAAKNFKEFDNVFTAPVHGFKDAEEYWKKCSSKPFIPLIETETCIINALNDPFLPKSSYPYTEAESNKNVQLFTPKHGGHVGFPTQVDGLNYYEKIILEFFKD